MPFTRLSSIGQPWLCSLLSSSDGDETETSCGASLKSLMQSTLLTLNLSSIASLDRNECHPRRYFVATVYKYDLPDMSTLKVSL